MRPRFDQSWRDEKHGKHPYRPRHRGRLRPSARGRPLHRCRDGGQRKAFADNGSIASVTEAEQGNLGSGVGGDDFGTAATTQQQAVGDGASNQSNTAQVNGSEFTAVDQGNANTAVSFSPLWW